jgi:cytochrome c oxidase cbb3-type subunit II
MKSNFVFFFGLFAALGFTYVGIVFGLNAQLGSLASYYEDIEGATFPQLFPSVIARGKQVSRGLGCVACDTQKVRRSGFGSDHVGGWGDCQSIVRDYICQPFPQLGFFWIGPDLTSVGNRKPSAPGADALLHMPSAGSEGMPPYRFLFEMRRIGAGAQPSDEALKLMGALEPKAGLQVVPTQRARDLVGYLVNLKTTHDYPEAVSVEPAKLKTAAFAITDSAAPTPTGVASPTPTRASQDVTHAPTGTSMAPLRALTLRNQRAPSLRPAKEGQNERTAPA